MLEFPVYNINFKNSVLDYVRYKQLTGKITREKWKEATSKFWNDFHLEEEEGTISKFVDA